MNLPSPSILSNVETWSGKGRHDENFPVGSVLIPQRYRDAIHRFYNFARNADDIADLSDLSPPDKLNRLNIMEDVLLGHRDFRLTQRISASCKPAANRRGARACDQPAESVSSGCR